MNIIIIIWMKWRLGQLDIDDASKCHLQSKCFFFGPIISSVVALHTDLASPWPAKLCRAANNLSFIVWPAIFFLISFLSFSYFIFYFFSSRKCYRFTPIRFVLLLNEVDGICFGLLFYHLLLFVGSVDWCYSNSDTLATLLFCSHPICTMRTNR